MSKKYKFVYSYTIYYSHEEARPYNRGFFFNTPEEAYNCAEETIERLDGVLVDEIVISCRRVEVKDV